MAPSHRAETVRDELAAFVDFDAIAESPAWIGFFEDPELSGSHVRAALDLFDAWSAGRSGGILYVATQRRRGPRTRGIERLIAAGLVQDGPDLDVDPLDTPVIIELDRATADLPTLFDATLRSWLYGWTMTYWPAVDLVVYPHDDMGFGCVATTLDGAGGRAGRELLDAAAATGVFAGASIDVAGRRVDWPRHDGV